MCDVTLRELPETRNGGSSLFFSLKYGARAEAGVEKR
jgi:hypothetical protein